MGQRLVDIHSVRDRNYKRETRLLNVLLFLKTIVWKALFGKEADKLEQATDNESVCESGSERSLPCFPLDSFSHALSLSLSSLTRLASSFAQTI